MTQKLTNSDPLSLVNGLLLILLFAFPLFPFRINGAIFILFSISTILNFFIYKERKFKFSFGLGIALLFPFLYLLSHWIYPSNFDSWFSIEKRAILFIAPLIFSIGSFKVAEKHLLMVFHIATSLLAIFIVGYLLINGLDPKFASGGTSFATRATIEQLVGIHPTYLSLLMAFSVLSIGRNTLNTKTIILNELFQILLLLIVIVLLSSKMVFIALGIITPIIVIYSPFKKLIKALSLIGFYISILLSIIFIPVLNQRFIELKSNWQNIPTESNANATNQRTAIYHCSWEVLKNNFWLGTGTAAQQDELNQCFDSTGISKLSAQKFNTHNEYLNVATALGLPGVISFFALLFYSFKKATKNPNHLLLLSLFCIVCLTENLLARHYGVFFFGILNFYYIFGKNGQTQN